MNRRLRINLAAFAALAVVMVVWAFNNVVRFDFIERPYTLSVEFASSPGLHPGFEVDYLGLRIGKIDSVRLEKNKVLVKLDIDRGVEIPRGATAAAARKSAVGEPVVELSPPAGGAEAPPMKAGEVIPLSRTSLPPEYGRLFDAMTRTLKAVDPGDVTILSREMAAALAGRERSIRAIIHGADQFTTTFAQETELLDGLTKDMGRITDVLNQNRGHLGAGLDNTAALTAALSEVRGELAELRDTGPELLKSFNELTDKTRSSFGCTVDMLGNLGLSRHNPGVYRDLSRVLGLAPEVLDVMTRMDVKEDGRSVLRLMTVDPVGAKAALQYKTPLPQPKVNQMRACRDGWRPPMAKQKPYAAKHTLDQDGAPAGTAGTRPQGADSAAADPQTRAKKAAGQRDESSGPPAWLIYVPPVLAGLLLARMLAGTVPVLFRLRRKR